MAFVTPVVEHLLEQETGPLNGIDPKTHHTRVDTLPLSYDPLPEWNLDLD